MGEAEIFAASLIPKSSLSSKWIDILKRTTKVILFEKGSLHMLGSDINCGLEKINEIKNTVGKLGRNFTSSADSQEINRVEIYRKFGFYENPV